MKRVTVIALFLLTVYYPAYSQKINRINSHGQRKGKWITYQDSAKTIKSFEGRFRNGRAVGKAYYYIGGGALERTEVSRFGVLKTVTYYPNCKKRSEGKARLENLPDRIHYYYFGAWKYYDGNGRPVKYCYYEKGKMIRTEYLDKSNKTNDSLISALSALEKEFSEKNTALINRVNMCIADQRQAELCRQKIYQADSIVFFKISEIVSHYGYPTKAVANEASTIPFFIISYAPLAFREKYESMFGKAADDGTLEWSSVAHFTDKIRIASGQQQVYGTQYYRDKSGEPHYYPSADTANLVQRRKMVGLGEP